MYELRDVLQEAQNKSVTWPRRMKLMRLDGQVLVEGSGLVPKPGRDEVLIRVRAVGVIPTELSWYPTLHEKSGAQRVGAVPCHEFSGTIAGTGREVFGMNDWYTDGALAEYCIAPLSAVIPKPVTLSHVQAASIPISALTAWQGLFDKAKLQAGERVLVNGAAGGVGTMVVQLARLHGAEVIANASPRNHDFLIGLGANEVVDGTGTAPVDVVLDTVGGQTLDKSWSALKPGGRLVTVVSSAETSTDPRSVAAFFIVESNAKQLTEIGKLLDARQLRPVVDSIFPFSHAQDVFAGRVPRTRRGKVVIEVSQEEER